MMTGNEICKISECCILFGIPMSESELSDAMRRVPQSDFLRGREERDYRIDTIPHARFALDNIQKTKIEVIRSVKYTQVINCYKNYKYIILFNHWIEKNDCVEFFDGEIPYSTIANDIPDGFQGIIDLCICNPQKLSDMIQSRGLNTLCRLIEKEVDIVFWLHFVTILFTVIDKFEMSYIDAVDFTKNQIK